MNRQEPSCGLASQTDVLAGSVTLRRTEAKQRDRNQEHIETHHLLPNLKRHTIVGGAIMISAQAAKFVLSLGSTVILARLLTPHDFGLVAMMTVVTGLFDIMSTAGLSLCKRLNRQGRVAQSSVRCSGRYIWFVRSGEASLSRRTIHWCP